MAVTPITFDDFLDFILNSPDFTEDHRGRILAAVFVSNRKLPTEYEKTHALELAEKYGWR